MAHILEVIFHIRSDHVLLKHLLENGVDRMNDFIQPSEDYTEPSFGYKAGQKAVQYPPRFHMSKVRVLQQYAAHHFQTTGAAMTDTDWLDLTIEAYDNFAASHPLKATVAPTPSMTPAGTPTPTSPTTPAALFRKGIKRDATRYPLLKQQKYYLAWHRTFVGEVHAQDLANVIDPSYIPVPPDVELFELQKNYMYSVFQTILLTDKGKTIVRTHSTTRDAQKIYADLAKYAKESTATQIELESLTAFLTTGQLDASWSGTTSGFVTFWRQQMSAFEDLTPQSEHWSDPTKKRHLMTAVERIQELRSIQTADETRVATKPGEQPATFDQYLTLLETATTRYDAQRLKDAKSARRTTRTANMLEYNPDPIALHMSSADYAEHGELFLDDGLRLGSSDTPTVPYQAFTADQRRPSSNRPWIPKELWTMIMEHPDLVAKWQAYDWNQAPANRDITRRRQQQANLLDLAQPTYEEFIGLADVPSSPPSSDPMHLELHKLVQSAVSDQLSSLASSITDTPGGVPTDSSDSSVSSKTKNPNATTDKPNSTILAHLTKQKTVKGGDLRQLIHQAAVKPANSSAAQTRSEPDTIPVMDYNGHRYVQINSLERDRIKWNVNLGFQDRSLESMFDRGANGGMLGGDAMILHYCSPPRYADVSGVALNDLNDLQIGTAAGKVQTHRGTVCLILHQYAVYGKGKTIHSCGQWEHNGHTIDDRSIRVGGKQRVVTADGYVIPLQIRNGLPYMEMTPPTKEELDILPHVHATSDLPWEPSILDCEQTIEGLDDLPAEPGLGNFNPFDPQGRYLHRSIYSLDIGDGMYVEMDFDDYVDACLRNICNLETLTSPDDGEPPGEPDPLLDPDPLGKLRATDIRVRGQAMELNDL